MHRHKGGRDAAVSDVDSAAGVVHEIAGAPRADKDVEGAP